MKSRKSAIAVGIVALILMAWPLAAAAAPALTLSKAVSPPTKEIIVGGTGFGANEAVDIYFDTTDVLLVATNASGAFSQAALKVPPEAQPGKHWITAIGRNTGRAAQKPLTVRTDWAQYGRVVGRTGYNPLENVLTRNNVSGLEMAWHFNSGFINYSSPAVVGGVVFFGSAGTKKVYARDAATGAKKWEKPTGAGIASSPAVVGGVLYIGSSNSLYAMNASDGFPKWLKSLVGAVNTAPAVAGGVVYAATAMGKLYAFKAGTGANHWPAPTDVGIFALSSPAVSLAQGRVYVGSADYKLYAVHPSTGAKVWERNLGAGVHTPAVSYGQVYAAAGQNLYALNMWNIISWQTAFPGGFSASCPPAVASGQVFIGADNGGGDNRFYAFNAYTGANRWMLYTDGKIAGASVANGVVFAASNNGVLYAIDCLNGAVLWVSKPAYLIFSTPTVVNGALYIGTYPEDFYAFNLEAGMSPAARAEAEARRQTAATPPDPSSLVPDYRLQVQDLRLEQSPEE
jgi:outer membrane protein assembly factor BamB